MIFGWRIAKFGHHWIHAWQSSQLWRNTGLPFSILILPRGQSFAQFPHPLQVSLIIKFVSAEGNDLSPISWNREPKILAGQELVSGLFFNRFFIAKTNSFNLTLSVLIFFLWESRILIILSSIFNFIKLERPDRTANEASRFTFFCFSSFFSSVSVFPGMATHVAIANMYCLFFRNKFRNESFILQWKTIRIK